MLTYSHSCHFILSAVVVKFTEAKHYHAKLVTIRKEMLLLHEMPQEPEERLLQIREQLRLYEDDYAEELLSQLLSILEKEE